MVEAAGSPSMTTSQPRSRSLLRPANGRVPIVTESFGGWHEVAVEERFVAVLARKSGQDCDAGRRLWARANLPFCCSGGVLAILVNRMPDFPATGIDGSYEAWL